MMIGDTQTLVVTETQRHPVNRVKSTGTDTVHYAVYEEVGRINGPRYVLMSLEMFEQLVKEINEHRATPHGEG